MALKSFITLAPEGPVALSTRSLETEELPETWPVDKSDKNFRRFFFAGFHRRRAAAGFEPSVSRPVVKCPTNYALAADLWAQCYKKIWVCNLRIFVKS
jgi:hypothetical protein